VSGQHPEVAIIGAGCAGLSLARALLRADDAVRITIFDPRTGFERDRTWCGWTLPDAAFDECVTHRWSRWIVTGPGGHAIAACESMPYRHIPADAYYRRAVGELDVSTRCRLSLGTAVHRLSPGGDRVAVETSAGRATFAHVFDGRPAPPPEGGPSLVQHFAGVEIGTDRAGFDPGVATLMDFRVPQADGIHFFYVLPFSERSALVEATFMTTTVESGVDYDARLEEYIREQLGIDAWRETRRETGRIPMVAAAPARAPHARVWRIGTGGGLVKPSTGYAFDAIHRDSERVARAWTKGRSRPPRARPRISAWLDRVMLSYLSSNPEAAARVFPRLFRRCPPPRLIRFLNDQGSAADMLAVMWSVPRLPIAWHCVRSAGGYL